MIAGVDTSELAKAVYMYGGMILLLFGICCVVCVLKIRRSTPPKIRLRKAMEAEAARKLRAAKKQAR